MLTHLSIRNIVLIEALDLTFEHGLTVLTGETGAGKSILLDGLLLGLGARGNTGLVRSGTERAQVTCSLHLPTTHPVWDILAEQDIVAEEGELVLRRSLTTDGRSKAFINDQPVSITLLREVGSSLIEIQGQFDQQGLLDSSNHRQALDLFAGLLPLRQETATAYNGWQTAQDTLANLQQEIEAARANQEYLEHAVAEFRQLDPQPDEEDALAERRQLLQSASKIGSNLSEAFGYLSHDDGVEAGLLRSTRLLTQVADKAGAKLDSVINSLDQALEASRQAAFDLEALQTELQADPQELERVEDRLFALRALARKHNIHPNELPAMGESLQTQLDNLSLGEERLQTLQAAARQAKEKYAALATDLSQKRQAAAQNLDKAVMAELPPLKLERARFETQLLSLSEDQWGPDGQERVQFLCSTNPGSPLAPLHKTASGGELSRFLLALKVVLSTDASVTTLVFDEVDSGVGGAVASAVGERLARLAQTMQVLTITHSPQVAARGVHHLRIEKAANDAHTITRVLPLDPEGRREEIARMLSGAEVTSEARAQAEKLMTGT